ncbi:tetratricopeptide repeat protein [Shimazuella kribbensis]|uniref:tetratricopeptide repeat protein n=1 Tax=Shimazuella kribbensis TaxID=139808 RepID=UPI0004003F20|nr:SEL1-like repeat protein [Shimazuella kribbensis]
MNQIELLHQAASNGNTDAMWELGTRYLEGNQLTQDAHEGERWLRNAAEMGDVASMRALGWRYLRGDGLTQNIEEGNRWLKKAREMK